MTDATALPPAARRYLEQLELEAAELPAADRSRLVAQIGEHLADAVDEGASVEAVVARLGSTRELVVEASAGDAPVAAAPAQHSILLWIAVLLLPSALLLLLPGVAMFAMTGRWRSVLVLLLPGLILALIGSLLLHRLLLSRHALPAATRERTFHGLAVTGLVLGAIVLLLGAGMLLLTGRGRSLLIALPGAVLVIVCGIALLRGRRRQRASTSPA